MRSRRTSPPRRLGGPSGALPGSASTSAYLIGLGKPVPYPSQEVSHRRTTTLGLACLILLGCGKVVACARGEAGSKDERAAAFGNDGRAQAVQPRPSAPQPSVSGKRLTVHSLRGLPRSTLRVARDPVYDGRSKRYEGYELKVLLDKLEASPTENAAGDPAASADDRSQPMLLFHCRDGYKPSMPLHLALQRRGLLALRDLDAPRGQDWETFTHDQVRATPAPAYLVWQHSARTDERYVWPYNVEALEVVDFKSVYQAALPDQAARIGDFFVFKQHCNRCHRINGVGGKLGPELNDPRNILSYWQEEDFRAFVRKPQSFRRSSSMPAQTQLSDAELDAIVRYLRAMERSG